MSASDRAVNRAANVAPVSVIVPTYNGELYLAEAIDSILAQTMVPAEVIVVDDGSTDGSSRVAAGYAPRVRLLRQENAGVASARNYGIAAATQPYLAFLDHDDVWLPYKTEAQVEALEQRPELAGVFGDMVEFLSPDIPADLARRLVPRVESQASVLICCMLIRTAEFHRVGPLDVDSHADFVDWYMRARDLGLLFNMVPELLVRRRVHGRNTSLSDKQVKRDYLKHIKASLDRRRAVGSES